MIIYILKHRKFNEAQKLPLFYVHFLAKDLNLRFIFGDYTIIVINSLRPARFTLNFYYLKSHFN